MVENDPLNLRDTIAKQEKELLGLQEQLWNTLDKLNSMTNLKNTIVKDYIELEREWDELMARCEGQEELLKERQRFIEHQRMNIWRLSLQVDRLSLSRLEVALDLAHHYVGREEETAK